MMCNVVKDPNEQPTLASIAIVRVENAVAWKLFYVHVQNDFPENELNVNDAHKGCISAASRLAIDRQSCFRHIGENVRKAFPGPMGFALVPIVYMVGKAASQTHYESALAFIHMSSSFEVNTYYN